MGLFKYDPHISFKVISNFHMAYKMVYVSHNKIHSPRLCIFITFVCKDKDCIRVFIIFIVKNFQFMNYYIYVGDGWFRWSQRLNEIYLTSNIDNITAHGFYCLCWIKFSLRFLLQKDLKPASREKAFETMKVCVSFLFVQLSDWKLDPINITTQISFVLIEIIKEAIVKIRFFSIFFHISGKYSIVLFTNSKWYVKCIVHKHIFRKPLSGYKSTENNNCYSL